MGGSGGGSQSTSTKSGPPKYVLPFAHQQVGIDQGLFTGSGYPQQQVAPFSPLQNQAINETAGLDPGTSAALNTAQNANTNIASGANLDPSTNKYLQDYYNAAAAPVVENYQTAVAPNLLSNAIESGGLGSTGTAQAFNTAQTDLGRSLGDLAANIYEPAYEAGLQQQATAIGQAPALASGQYIPSQELNTVGTQQQQQAQDVFNALYSNQMQPYNMATLASNLISGLSGGGGQAFSVTSTPGGGSIK